MARPSSPDGDPVDRRDLLAGGAAAVAQQLAGCYEAAFGDDGPGTDWPMPHHDAANTGTTHGSAPSVDPVERWRFAADGPVVAAPIVAGGLTYVTTVDGHLYAIDSERGELEWDVAVRGAGDAPAVVDGTVHVGARWNGDARLAALDADSGTLEWDHAAGGERYRAPTVVDGWIFVESPPIGLLALDAATGEEQWRAQFPGRSAGTPAVVEGSLYMARNRTPGSGGDPLSTVLALDASTGEELWTVEKRAEIRHTPAVIDGTVYVDRFALDVRNGADIWETGAPVGQSAPAVAGGSVFVDGDGGLLALDAGTGEVLWSYPGFESAGGAPMVGAGTVYATGTDGVLRAVAADTGEEHWRYDVVDEADTSTVWSAPVVADGAVYVGSGDGSVHAIE